MSIRKAVCVAVAVLCVGVVGASAELHDNAIGLRLGYGSLLGGELNYQRALGSNRLEIGASYEFSSTDLVYIKYTTNYFGLAVIYQWRWDISAVNGLGWYAGPGAHVSLSSWGYEYSGVKYSDSDFWVNVGGQIGIEYDLNTANVPLLLSIDARPMYGVLHSGGFGWAAALGIRYTF